MLISARFEAFTILHLEGLFQNKKKYYTVFRFFLNNHHIPVTRKSICFTAEMKF